MTLTQPLNTFNIQNFHGIFHNLYSFQPLFHDFVKFVGFTETLTFRIRISSQIFGPNIVTSCFLPCVPVLGTCSTFLWDKQILFYLCINRYAWKTYWSGFMLFWDKFNNICTLMHWNKTSYQHNVSKLCWTSGWLESSITSYGSNALILLWSDFISIKSII